LTEPASDPVATGLVASLARPGGNLTGVSLMQVELMPKLLELVLDLLPGTNSISSGVPAPTLARLFLHTH
jgi:putative ABC transport system substrate-binding protein